MLLERQRRELLALKHNRHRERAQTAMPCLNSVPRDVNHAPIVPSEPLPPMNSVVPVCVSTSAYDLTRSATVSHDRPVIARSATSRFPNSGSFSRAIHQHTAYPPKMVVTPPNSPQRQFHTSTDDEGPSMRPPSSSFSGSSRPSIGHKRPSVDVTKTEVLKEKHNVKTSKDSRRSSTDKSQPPSHHSVSSKIKSFFSRGPLQKSTKASKNSRT